MTARRSATVGAIAAAGLVGLLLILIAGLWFVQRDRTLPNTFVAGIDVSRMTADEVRAAVGPTADARQGDAVVLRFEDETREVAPADVGYGIDVDATVETALRRGRTGLPGDVATRIGSLRTAEDVAFVEAVDEGRLDDFVTALAEELDRDESPGSVSVDPDTLEVAVDLPQGHVEVQQGQTRALLLAAMLDEGPDEFDLPAEVRPQPVPDEDVEMVAAQVERAVSGPLVLRSGDASLTLEPRDVALLIAVREVPAGSGSTLELAVTADAVEQVMGEVASGRLDRAPVDASFSASRTPPRTFDAQGDGTFQPVPASVTVEPARPGARFDAGTTATQVTALLQEGAREAELRLEPVEPDLSTDRAEALAPTHLIGTFTTFYQAGQDRNRNIQRLADLVDGTVVPPGEQFSINRISGERSCDKGFVPAGTIVRGELVDTCGGGVSQFGTTTFNAAFFAGVQLDQWQAHSWYISRYPMGREATLSYPELDVRFTNTTDGVVIVKTAHTDTSVTVSLYGRPIARAVSAAHGAPTDPREFSTTERTTADLVRGEERVLQPGTDGFTVEVVRTVERLDGSTDRQTIRTVYVPQTRIVEQGTRAPSEPPPPPDEPDPDEAADADASD